MIVDGKAIAQSIYKDITETVLELGRAPRLVVITCQPNFETRKYLNLKRRKAYEVGIDVELVELDASVTSDFVVESIQKNSNTADGVVLQLPLPDNFDREKIMAAIPVDKDPDGFSYGSNKASCLPPVVAAVAEIAKIHDIDLPNKKVVVLGQGRLVGKPVTEYLHIIGADPVVIVEDSVDYSQILVDADVIISGIGKPQFITPEMVKSGVVVFDAGTSEDGGELVGDVHPSVADKASIFTPVPGGIGPITIACLLRNLVELSRK